MRAALIFAIVASSSAHAINVKTSVVANHDGDRFGVDLLWPTTNHMWVRPAGSGTWTDWGRPPGTANVAYGLSPVQASYGYKGVFLVGDDGHLYELYKNGAVYSWTDHGKPSCGSLIGAPSAMTAGSYVGVVALCQDGTISERYYSSGWIWANHGKPGTATIATDPVGAASATFRGAVIRDTAGNAWTVEWVAGDIWTWHARSNPGVSLVGDTSFVLNPYTGYIGGLFVGSNGNAYELYRSAGNWFWASHGSPPTCTLDTNGGSGFTMDTSSGSSSVVGVTFCSGHGAITRRYYLGGWAWGPSQAPAASDPWHVPAGKPFAAVTTSGGYQALLAAYGIDGGAFWDDWSASTLNGVWEWLNLR